MADNREWNGRDYGEMRWRQCPPCPPCPPCGPGRPQPGPGRPQPGPGRPQPRPGRPYPGSGDPECPPGMGPFCNGWRRGAAMSDYGSVHEMEQAPMDDLYMTDEPEKEWMEQQWLYMKQLYPNSARKLHKYIDDALDKLEYENSMMFDEYPDNVAVMQLVHEVIAAIQENEPALLTEQLFEDNMNNQQPMQNRQPTNNQQPVPMQNQQPMDESSAISNQQIDSRPANQTWSHCTEVLIQVMLLAEMHHRRWRYFQLRRRSY